MQMHPTTVEDIPFTIKIEREFPQQVWQWTEEQHTQWLDELDGDKIPYFSFKNSKDEIIGYAILSKYRDDFKSAYLRRFAITKDAQGSDVALQCINLVQDYIFNTLNYERLELNAYEDNERANAFWQKSGFTQEGMYRKAQTRPSSEERHSLYIYGMLKEEFTN